MLYRLLHIHNLFSFKFPAICITRYINAIPINQTKLLAFKKFIELDYQDKVLMSKNSRKHIEEIFDKRKVVKETKKGLEA